MGITRLPTPLGPHPLKDILSVASDYVLPWLMVGHPDGDGRGEANHFITTYYLDPPPTPYWGLETY